MVYRVKAFSYVSIKYKFGLHSNTEINCLNRIVTGTSWSKTLGVRLEFCLPFWL